MKQFLLPIALIVAALFAGACSSSPEPNFTNLPGHFKFTKMQNDLFTVEYTAEAYTSETKARQLAGQRVATLCLNEGYRYFITLDRSTNWLLRPAQLGFAPEHTAGQAHQVPQIRGSVRFFEKEPAIQTKAVFDAKQVEANLSAF